MPSFYHKHMKQWLKYFPLSQILILESEELTKVSCSKLNPT